MKKIIVILFLVGLVFGILFWLFKKEAAITNYPPEGKTIVALGDSLIRGVGATDGNDFVSLLEKQIGEPILNMGVPGNTTSDGLAQIEAANKEDPKVVLLLLGGNDFLRKIPLEDTFRNLDQIVLKLQNEGAVVVLLGIRGGLLGDPYQEYFEELAEQRGTLYVPDVLDGLVGQREFMSDSIHPNDLGYRKIALKVLPVLKKALGK